MHRKRPQEGLLSRDRVACLVQPIEEIGKGHVDVYDQASSAVAALSWPLASPTPFDLAFFTTNGCQRPSTWCLSPSEPGMGGSASDEPWLALRFNFLGHFKLAKSGPCVPLEAGT